MTKIDNLSSSASQITRVILTDGSILTLEARYMAAVQRWNVNLSWPGPAAAPLATPFQINGLNLSHAPNILRPWRDLIPFGLSCVAKDGVDPIDVNDFEQERVQLYILDNDEVLSVEQNVYGSLS